MVNKDLILVSGDSEGKKLARDIFRILREEYSIGEDVKVLEGKKANELTPEEKVNKNETRPLVIDEFPDTETRVEAGLFSVQPLTGAHVVYIDYLFQPNSDLSINDRLSQARGFGEMLEYIPIRKLTFCFPYSTYVRAHSVEKYAERGFLQANILRRFIRDFSRLPEDWPNKKARVELITIDVHNEKIFDYCKRYSVLFHHYDPFRAEADYTKLGINKLSDDVKPRLARLTPFLTFYKENEDRLKDAVVVIADDGTEDRTKSFGRSIGELYENMPVAIKDRIDAGNIRVAGFKPFGKITLENIIKGKTAILIDDLLASGGTAVDTTTFLKEKCGASYVIWLLSHNVNTDPSKIETSSIDELYVLDTVPQKTPKVNVLEYSKYLLASRLYKSYKADIPDKRVITF
ncbi:ribose-phosphate pyrophosphokinase [Candidatus Woesearchaeota archaeon]|nr:ribose-phosphate pyrophosphokinase [Candidatus Woesearchaeota archaeon]